VSLPQSTPVPLRLPGLARPLHLYVHGERDAHVSRRIREEGVWEPCESGLVLNLLQPGQVFVDAGANIGYFTLLAASRVGPGGRVFAFEPDPDNFRLLEANVELNGVTACVTAVQAALGERSGAGRLYLSRHNLGDHRVCAADDARDSLPIAQIPGGEYLAGRAERVDLVKVDTQGAEYHVIAGLMPWLATLAAPPRFIVELTPHALRQAGASGRALVELLGTLGQPMWIIDHTEGRLFPSSAEDLSRWCDNWDTVPESRGFMNILVGEPP